MSEFIDSANVPAAGDYASKGEIAAWAMYDVANSTYTTIVSTAVYNAYFVKVIAASLASSPATKALPTLYLSGVVCISSFLIVLTAPVIGTIGDATARKKALLFAVTVVCVLSTAALGAIQPGDYLAALVVLAIANTAFGTGEDLIAAFLPELGPPQKLGRISAYGWSAGYIGGLIALAVALLYVNTAQAHGQTSREFVPAVMLMCAGLFALASAPTFLWMKERAKPDDAIRGQNYIKVGFCRLRQTIERAVHFRDLFAVLIAIVVYQCGVGTVVYLASVYAQEVMKFTEKDLLIMILVVNITASIGAFIFGFVQDRIGSIRTLCITMVIWIAAIVLAYLAQTKTDLWIAANLVGMSMGASGSAGRALVSKFSPPGRSGEFLGLWGVAVKLATAIGVLSFGLVSFGTNNYRIALLCTGLFFIVGFLLLRRVNEKRGIDAAHRRELIESIENELNSSFPEQHQE